MVRPSEAGKLKSGAVEPTCRLAGVAWAQLTRLIKASKANRVQTNGSKTNFIFDKAFT
jgi:hypothetical protein